MGGRNSSEDSERYRNGYPGQEDNLTQNDNLKFYKGEMESVPDGDFIDNIHKKWQGKYGALEAHHGYIQWLFPIREHGMNMQSQPLQKHEMEAMRSDENVRVRIIKSYELMLDFYGMKLVNRETGEIARSDNYKDRYYNLNTSSHNYLRITRILKCLGEMNLEHLKKPWCEFFIKEVYVNKELLSIRGSLRNYWVAVLRKDDERQELLNLIDKYDPPREHHYGGTVGALEKKGPLVVNKPEVTDDTITDKDVTKK